VLRQARPSGSQDGLLLLTTPYLFSFWTEPIIVAHKPAIA